MENPFNLKNRIALVTDAGHGIGREIAQVLAQARADIAVAELDVNSGQQAAEQLCSLAVASACFSVDIR
jgi:3-oxoacyl-[acyl-carrier protein] reductase